MWRHRFTPFLLAVAACAPLTSSAPPASRSALTTVTTTDQITLTAAAPDVTCGGSGQATITIEQPALRDVTILVQDSSNISASEFTAAKSFANNLVASLDVRADGDHVAVVRFGATSVLDHSLGGTQTAAAVTTAINGLTRRGGIDVDARAPINSAITDLNAQGRPATRTKRVLVLVSDGDGDHENEPPNPTLTSPCDASPTSAATRAALTSTGASVIFVTNGDPVTSATFSCLQQSPASQTIAIQDFSGSSFTTHFGLSLATDFGLTGTQGSPVTINPPLVADQGSASITSGSLSWTVASMSNGVMTLQVPYTHDGSAASPATILSTVGLAYKRGASPQSFTVPNVTTNVGTCAPGVALAPASSSTVFGQPASIGVTVTGAGATDCVRLYRGCTTSALASCSGVMPGTSDVALSSGTGTYTHDSLAVASHADIRGFLVTGCVGAPAATGSAAVLRTVTAASPTFASLTTGSTYTFGSGSTTLTASLAGAAPSSAGFAGGTPHDPASFGAGTGFGAVQFYRDPTTAACTSGTALGSPRPVSTTGVATASPTSTDIPGGTHQICGVYTPNPASGFYYAGTGSSVTAPLVVNKTTPAMTAVSRTAPTGTTPVAYGTTTIFATTITGVASAPGPNSTVTFTDSSVDIPGCINLALGTGTVSCTPSPHLASNGAAGMTHTIAARYNAATDPNYGAATAAAFSHTVNEAATLTSIIASTQNPSLVGEAVTFTVLVGGGASGTIALREGATTLVDPCTPSAPGVWTCATTAGMDLMTPGPHALTAVYDPESTDPNYATSTSSAFTQNVDVTPADSTVSFVAPVSTSTPFGNPVTFTVQVADTGGNGRPTGTIGWTLLSQPAASPMLTPSDSILPSTGNNEVSLAIPANQLRPGTYVLKATYSGDATHATRTAATATHTLAKAAVGSFVVTRTAGTLHAGDFVTFTATAKANASTVIPSGGTVTFTDSIDGVLGTAVLGVAGTAAVARPSTATGTDRLSVADDHVLTATYDATNDASYTNATTTTSFAIARANVTATLQAASASPSRPGAPVTFSLAVALTNGHGQPKGVATITDTFGGVPTTLCTGTGTQACTRSTSGIDDNAHDGALYSVTTSNLANGAHSISATYDASADPSFTGTTVTGSPLAHSVDPTAPSIILTSSANPAVIGQSVKFSAIVTSTSGGTPTGDVLFADSATQLGTVPLVPGSSSSSAMFSTSTLSAGPHVIKVTFAGAEASIGQVVERASTAVTLTATPNPSPVGRPFGVVATVVSGTPGSISGSVTFMDGAKLLGSADLSDGVVSYAVFGLGAGAHTLTASYSGDAVYAPSTGTVTQTIDKEASTPGPGADAGTTEAPPAVRRNDPNGGGCSQTTGGGATYAATFLLGVIGVAALRRRKPLRRVRR